MYFYILFSGDHLRDYKTQDAAFAAARGAAAGAGAVPGRAERGPALRGLPVWLHHLQPAGGPAPPLPRPPRQSEPRLPCLQPGGRPRCHRVAAVSSPFCHSCGSGPFSNGFVFCRYRIKKNKLLTS